MVKMNVVYQGEKHCSLTHGPSGSHIETDAPKDNNGKGESFSPTDLVGAALASCILTTIAIIGEKKGLSFAGAKAEVEKEMTSAPRRIASLKVKVTLPSSLTDEQRRECEEIALNCPVHRSLHPDVQLPIIFIYN